MPERKRYDNRKQVKDVYVGGRTMSTPNEREQKTRTPEDGRGRSESSTPAHVVISSHAASGSRRDHSSASASKTVHHVHHVPHHLLHAHIHRRVHAIHPSPHLHAAHAVHGVYLPHPATHSSHSTAHHTTAHRPLTTHHGSTHVTRTLPATIATATGVGMVTDAAGIGLLRSALLMAQVTGRGFY